MDIRADEISKIIRDQIGGFALDIDVSEVGTVISIGDVDLLYLGLNIVLANVDAIIRTSRK